MKIIYLDLLYDDNIFHKSFLVVFYMKQSDWTFFLCKCLSFICRMMSWNHWVKIFTKTFSYMTKKKTKNRKKNYFCIFIKLILFKTYQKLLKITWFINSIFIWRTCVESEKRLFLGWLTIILLLSFSEFTAKKTAGTISMIKCFQTRY